MPTTEYTFVGTFNVDQLAIQLSGSGFAGYDGVISQAGSDDVIVRVDDSVSRATVQAVIDAHDDTVLTDEQKTEAARGLSRDEIKTRFIAVLEQGSPNTGAVYTALQGIISNNTELANAHANTGALFGYDIATQTGYLRAAYLMIGLYT